MERIQQSSNRLADRTRTTVTSLYAAHKAGRLTRAQFRAQATAAVAQANTAGVMLADIGLAAEVTKALGQPTGALGLLPNAVQVDQDRMGADIDRLLDDFEDPEGMLGDWAASEPLLTTSSAVQAGMIQRRIPGWTRVLSGTSCPLCTGWADGVVRSAETRMARHIGCDCIQQPVFEF